MSGQAVSRTRAGAFFDLLTVAARTTNRTFAQYPLYKRFLRPPTSAALIAGPLPVCQHTGRGPNRLPSCEKVRQNHHQKVF